MTFRQRMRVWAGRLRREPKRDTTLYPRLMQLGGWQQQDRRPQIKPTPTNLRQFGKTPAARRAIRRIKDPIAMLPWEIVPKEGVKLNAALQKQIDVAKLCLEHPNQDDSGRSLMEQLVEDLLVAGAGCYEQQTGGDQARPLWIWPVDALSIQVYAAWSGKRDEARYCQSLGYGNIGGIRGKDLLNDELVYIKQDPSTDSPFGLGCLEVAFSTINRKLGVADYAGNLASNAQPENLLLFKGASQPDIQAIRNFWRNEIEGQGQTPIFGGDEITVEKLRGTDDKALFLTYQEFLLKEICQAFDLHPHNMGITAGMNRATAEVADEQDWNNAIAPRASNIASYITRETLHAKLGFYQLVFQFIGLQRDDVKLLADVFEIEYQNNAITPNEYRARTRKPPMPGPWGDMTSADVEIAKSAARGAAVVDDPALPGPKPSPASLKEKQK